MKHLNANDAKILLKHIGELLPASIFAKDLDRRYTYANSAFLKTLPPTDLNSVIGKTADDILGPERSQIANQEDIQILDTGEPILNRENLDRRTSKELRWNLISKLPIREESGDISGIIGMAMDIHELKLAQQNIQELADQLAVKNAKLETNLSLAKQIHKSFFPQLSPRAFQNRIRLAFKIEQHDGLGGDFIKIAESSKGECLVFICDVMGHGVQAALIASLLFGQIDRMSEEMQDPGDYLSQINQRFTKLAQRTEELHYATALCLKFNPEEGTLVFANAGHPPPLHFDAAAKACVETERSESTQQGAIGLLAETRYPSQSLSLKKGDAFFLYSDGITEALGDDEQELGIAWLKNAIETAASNNLTQTTETLFQNFRNATQNRPVQDDISFVALGR